MAETKLIEPIYNIYDLTVVPVLFGCKIFDNREKKQAIKKDKSKPNKNKTFHQNYHHNEASYYLELINNDSEAQAEVG